MEDESICSLKVTVMGASVRTPVALFAGAIKDIAGGVKSAALAVKVKVRAEANPLPARSVTKLVVAADITFPSKKDAAGIKAAVVFAGSSSHVPVTGVPFTDTVNVVSVIEDRSMGSSNVAVTATFAGIMGTSGK
jgi:hypothetical protein